jgi:HEAT repeat protein
MRLERTRLAAVAAIVLAAHGAAAAQEVVSPYHTGQPDLRSPYEKALDGSSVEDFARLLRSPEAKQRLLAVEDLGQCADPHAINYLLKAMNDVDLRVQARAIDYLGARRSADATPLLAQKLFFAGAPDALRQRILSALGKIGDPAASRPVLDFIAQEANPDVRGTGIYTLGEIGDVTVRDELRKLGEKETDPRLKQLIEETLVKMTTMHRPPTQSYVPPPRGVVPPLK